MTQTTHAAPIDALAVLSRDVFALPIDPALFLSWSSARMLSALFTKVANTYADVNFGQFLAMSLLREGLAETSGQISDFLTYDKGALTRQIDDLERKQLVRRCRSLGDRRVVKLAITGDGVVRVDALRSQLSDMWEKIFEGLSRRERYDLARLQSRLSIILALNNGI